ncbi:SGNH/GDSL hydrolase family protein [Cohnella rhizosphaerae]|uniref:SGNH/GDSL hydrolase family protein n=1 Tax=Cohnella rhizosphaerae TaxID=1457232 RepID=A0A9X4L463_9BACL|nr:SGNH/GDSL hydrolase family protein [Cohnella rhizosphaerae]MDG0813444.1 SGNH/GDSL hydrolase family protein [Cohnella rhizosphaerae]
MNPDVWRHRGPLAKLREKLKSGAATIGFLGGSITEAAPGYNWPEKVLAWLTETYPAVRFTVENAAIGATGSDLACFRVRRDIIDRQCDIVFVEYAVNDHYADKEIRKRAREGLIRQLLAWGEADIVLVYTYLQAMYADMSGGRVPDSVAELEQLARHYGIGSIWAGLYAFEEVRKGRMDWDEWLPDGLHPTHRGKLELRASRDRLFGARAAAGRRG